MGLTSLRPRTFLTAEWRNLAMVNFVVDAAVLEPFVPAGTILDHLGGKTFVSLVGFLFADTKVLGLSIPAHRTFEEINLRFYVRREVGGEVRRGVTFLREFVPRGMIALTARLLYNEPYRAVPMRHDFGPARPDGIPSQVRYAFRAGGGDATLALEADGEGRLPAPGSEEEFITEHYWGYTRQRDGGTVEYRVEHPRWRVWSARSVLVDGDLLAAYGGTFGGILAGRPSSAFLADGSSVTVFRPSRLPGEQETRGASR